jgi:hypothetical protein
MSLLVDLCFAGALLPLYKAADLVGSIFLRKRTTMRTRGQGMDVCGNQIDGYCLANTRDRKTINATIN